MSRNLSPCLSGEASTILQSLQCVHPSERDDLEFSAFVVVLSLDFFAQVKVDSRLTQAKS